MKSVTRRLGQRIRTLRFALAFERTIARARLPGSSRPRGDGSGGATCAVAAGSFLLHFALLSALASDWADEIVDERHVVTGLVERLRLPPTTARSDAAEPYLPTPYVRQCAGSQHYVTEEDVQLERVDPGRTAALMDKLHRPSSAVVTSPQGRRARAPDEPLRGDLDGVRALWRPLPARVVDTLEPAVPPLDLAVLTSRVVPRDAEVTGRGRWSRSRNGRFGPPWFPGYSATSLRGHEYRTWGETLNFRRLFPLLRTCYRDGLGRDAGAHGTLAFVLAVHPSGRVDHVAVTTEGRVARGTVGCMEDALWSLRFHPLDAPRGLVRGEHGAIDPSASAASTEGPQRRSQPR